MDGIGLSGLLFGIAQHPNPLLISGLNDSFFFSAELSSSGDPSSDILVRVPGSS